MAVVGVRAAHMHDARKRVEGRLAEVGGRLSSSQIKQLVDYLLLLDRWNRRMNLTALDDPDGAVDRLIVEPVLASAAIADGARVLVDIGAGRDSPAIPVSLAAAELVQHLMEL